MLRTIQGSLSYHASGADDFWRFLDSAVISLASRVIGKKNKAPSLNGIPNRVLILAVNSRSDKFAELFGAYVLKGIFPG